MSSQTCSAAIKGFLALQTKYESVKETRDGIRVLLIAEAANPEWTSVPLVGWLHSRAIMEIVDAHLVTQIRNYEAVCRAGLIPGTDFTAIDSERVARIVSRIRKLVCGGKGRGWTTATALNAISYYYFEHLLWKRFGQQIKSGAFDIVHRITPLSPTTPSLIAARCRRAGVPFVLGPLNGGLPWPKGFDRARRNEREWLSYVRGAYKLLPGYTSTRRSASALIIGSRDTWTQMPARYHHKSVYIPENAIDPARFTCVRTRRAKRPIRLVLVGRLVPYKGADMLIEAAAPIIRAGEATLTIIGDGPQMPLLKDLVERNGTTGGVTFTGWVEHKELQHHLVDADLFVFPSIREFGGAVALEAMAMGLVPIVVDYGGPSELVTEATGFAVPIGSRDEIIRGFNQVLTALVENPQVIGPMGERARQGVFSQFTWDVKARQTLEVYRWVLGDRPDKPDFGMPLSDSPVVLATTR